MAVSNVPVFPQTPQLGLAQFTSTMSTTFISTLFAASTNGGKISGIFVSNSDTVFHAVQISITRSGGSTVGIIFIGATGSVGFSTVAPAVNAFSTVLIPGLPSDFGPIAGPYLLLSTLDSLTATFTTTMTTGTLLNVVAVGRLF